MKIKGKSITPAQLTLQTHLEELGVKTVFEYRFLEDRKYAFDLYDEESRIGYEADGGTWTSAPHRPSRPTCALSCPPCQNRLGL